MWSFKFVIVTILEEGNPSVRKTWEDHTGLIHPIPPRSHRASVSLGSIKKGEGSFSPTSVVYSQVPRNPQFSQWTLFPSLPLTASSHSPCGVRDGEKGPTDPPPRPHLRYSPTRPDPGMKPPLYHSSDMSVRLSGPPTPALFLDIV